MIEKLIIHAGTHKTGTTSIQQFCSNHARHFTKEDVTYPTPFDKSSGHHELGFALDGKPQNPKSDKPPQEIADHYLKQAQRHGTKRLFLSSETYCFLSDDNINRLKEILPAKEYNVFFFFRRQDHYLESAFKQQTETYQRRIVESPFEYYLRRGLFTRLDYNALIERWSAVFGGEQVQHYSFEGSVATQGGVVGRLIGAAIAPHNKKLLISERTAIRSNVSLSATSVLALREINRSNDLSKNVHARVLEVLAGLDREYSGPATRLLDVSERRAMVRYYTAANRKLFPGKGRPSEFRFWRWDENDEQTQQVPSPIQISSYLEAIEKAVPNVKVW